MPRGRSIPISSETLERAIAALDTANGCLQLVKEGIRITDLPDCHAEIMVAYDALCALAGEHTAQED